MSSTATAVYKVRFSEGYEWLLPVVEADVELLRFDGQKRIQSWVPVSMKRLKVSERGRALKPTAFPACSGGDMLIVNQEGKEKLGAVLEHYGELLPLDCDEGAFWILNVTHVVDALDEERSQVTRANDTRAMLGIRGHVFRRERLAEAGIFKIPQMLRGLIYVTNAVAARIEATGVKGIEFVKVWEAPPNDPS